jgi:hypothetical protein
MLIHIQGKELQGSGGSALGHSPRTGGVSDRLLPGSYEAVSELGRHTGLLYPEQSQGLLGPHLQGREAQALL